MDEGSRNTPIQPTIPDSLRDLHAKRYQAARFRVQNLQYGYHALRTTYVQALRDIVIPPEQQETSNEDGFIPLSNIKKGDVIDVIKRCSENEWLGSLRDSVGLFPVNTAALVG
jgi:hypothetical protein